MGLTAEDFKEATDLLMAQMPADIYCDDQKCLLKKSCKSYIGKIPDLKLNVSNRADFTVKGDDLLANKNVVDKTGEYLCEVLLFNSDNVYMIGSALLKDYYAVYDVDSYKIALGKVVDFDAPPPQPKDVIDDDEANGQSKNVPEGGEEEQKIIHDDVKNALIFGGIAFIFIIVSCIICKRRRDAERNSSGSQISRKDRKSSFPMMEDDPNRSLTLGREYPSKLEFVEGSGDEEDEGDEEENDENDDSEDN